MSSSMINFPNNPLYVEITGLEAEVNMIDPKTGMEKVNQIFTGILTQMHSEPTSLEGMYAIQHIFNRANDLQIHLAQRISAGQI